MKNVSFNVNVKWNGPLKSTALGATFGSEGSKIRDREQQTVTEDMALNTLANRFFDARDHRSRLDSLGSNPDSR